MATQPGTKIPGTDLWVRVNKRGHKEYYVSKTHKSIDDLREIIINIRDDERGRITDHMTSKDIEKLQRYIVLNIAKPNVIPEDRNTVPHYPRPVKFHVSRIAHVTTQRGLSGILDWGGFRRGPSGLLWWGLVIGPEDIFDAEESYLQKLFPDRSQEEKERKEPFLRHFTTSPAFVDTSRYGNFRFTFPLADVLQTYSTQFCRGQNPVLRIYETIVYKQEVMYVVLIHSPDVHDYIDYPVLGDNDDGVCAYRDGEIIWRAQAISETHRFRLAVNSQENQVQVENVERVFYVWDHVTLAFHLPPGKILQCHGLLDSLSACDNGDVPLNPLIGKAAAETIIQAHYQSGGPQASPQHHWGSFPFDYHQPHHSLNYTSPMYDSLGGHRPTNYHNRQTAPNSHRAFESSYMPRGGHGLRRFYNRPSRWQDNRMYDPCRGHGSPSFYNRPPRWQDNRMYDPCRGHGSPSFYNRPPRWQDNRMYDPRGGYDNTTCNNRWGHAQCDRDSNFRTPRWEPYPTTSNRLQPDDWYTVRRGRGRAVGRAGRATAPDPWAFPF